MALESALQSQDSPIPSAGLATAFAADVASLLSRTGDREQDIVRLVERILEEAMRERTSDIHIEATRGGTMVRFRRDGPLRPVLLLPAKFHESLTARLKLLGNLRLDEHRRPQDGRIERSGLSPATLRMATIPTLYGEKVALRILEEGSDMRSLADLGLDASWLPVVERAIERPFGMIIASGPTGSGKTTTLYALLRLICHEGINVSTLEDPIEYILEGVNQIQANPPLGLTFASGLRSILRQDPDVIMVGEIRDSETAIMAANAALTGHLVLTTIHTNDAPSVFARLLEMKVDDFVVGSTVSLVIAQRLVRKVCAECAVLRPLPRVVFEKLKTRPDVRRAIRKNRRLRSAFARRRFRVGAGCDACLGTGYRGRAGIFEILAPNREVHDLVFRHAPAERIRRAAERAGFRDMAGDGMAKVASGLTTLEEVLRSTSERIPGPRVEPARKRATPIYVYGSVHLQARRGARRRQAR